MKEKASKLSRPLCAAALAVSLGLLVFLAAITTLSADDYWYSTFWREGLGGWLALMAEHYRTFNGRILVHFFAQLTLLLGNWAFALACGGFTAAIPLLTAGAGEKKAPALPAAAFFCGALLLLPTAYFAKAYLWTSAFFNYVFPTALTVLELFLLERSTRRGSRAASPIFLLVLTFLSGATTEQSGAVAVGLGLCFALESLLLRRGRYALGLSLTCALSSALGLLTILLSPATLARAKQEINGPIFRRLWNGLQAESSLLLGSLWVCLVLSAVLLAVGLFLWLRRGRRPAALLWVLPALLPLVGRLARGGWKAAVLLVLLGALAACAAVLLLSRADRPSAFLLLAAVGYAAVMLPTNSIAERTLLPALLCLLAAAARMGPLALDGLSVPQALPACLAALAALISILPQLPGYLHNYRVEQENLGYIRNLKSTDVLYCNVDYLSDYTHVKMTGDGHFYEKFLDYAGFSEGDQVYLLTADGYSLYVSGQHWSVPACRVDGQLFLHVRALEPLGGSVEYTQGHTEVRLGDRSCTIEGGQAVWTDGAGKQQSIAMTAVPNLGAFAFLPAGFCSEVLGVEVSVDEASRTVSLSLQLPLQP